MQRSGGPAGFPTVAGGIAAITTVLNSGADVVEIGLPHTDPVLDGPVIQTAVDIALRSGVRIRDVIATVREAHRATSKAVLVMSYWNPIDRYGLAQAEGVTQGPFGKKGFSKSIIPNGRLVPVAPPAFAWVRGRPVQLGESWGGRHQSVVADRGPDLQARLVQAALEGGLADAGDLGRLPGGEPLDVAQHDRGPQRRRQPGHGAGQRQPQLAVLGLPGRVSWIAPT